MQLRWKTGLAVLAMLLVVPLIAADVAGKWIFEVDLDMGSGTATFVFQQEGNKLTGTYSGALGNADLSGSVKENKIEFSFDSEVGRVQYSGTIDSADQMKGKADYGGQASGTWTAKRAE